MSLTTNLTASWKTLLRVMALGLWLSPQLASAQPSPILFYKDLAGSIATAKGRVLFDLSQGHWKTRVANENNYAIWDIDEGTVATVTFDYANGALRSASADFRPPVHVWLLGSQSVSGTVSHIEYNQDGDIVNWNIHPDNPKNTDFGGVVKLKRHLEFSRTPAKFFMATPFRGSEQSSLCTDGKGANCPNKRPMIYRIRLNSAEGQPGLAVALKDNYTINLSHARKGQPGLYDNFITVQQPSTFEFDNVEYLPETQEVSGELVSFRARLNGGRIATEDATFRLAANTSVSFGSVEFSRSQNRTGRITVHGAIDGTLGTGSEIALTTGGDNYTRLSIDAASVQFVNTTLDISDKGSTSVAVGAGSTARLTLLASRLGFGAHGFIQIARGSSTLSLFDSNWSSGDKPSVSGRLSLDVKAGLGRVELNSASSVNVKNGTVVASDLTFNSNQVPLLVGKFTSVAFELVEHSTIGVPNGLQFDTGGNAALATDDVDHPFELELGHELPVGSFKLDLQFHKLSSAPHSTFGLYEGQASLSLLRKTSGEIDGKDITVDGILRVEIESATHEIGLKLYSGTLTAQPNHDAEMDALWRFDLPGNDLIGLSTPFEMVRDDHGNMTNERHFPMPLKVGLATDARWDNVPIHFSGRRFSTEFTRSARLRVRITPGCGEHSDPDQPWNGCKSIDDQDDAAKGNQEAFTDTYASPLSCRLHLYLKPATYDIDSSIKIRSVNDDNGGLEISFASFSQPDVQWTEDGCGIQKAVLNFVAAIRRMTGLHTVPDSMRDGVNAFIENRIKEVLQRIGQRSFRIKV